MSNNHSIIGKGGSSLMAKAFGESIVRGKIRTSRIKFNLHPTVCFPSLPQVESQSFSKEKEMARGTDIVPTFGAEFSQPQTININFNLEMLITPVLSKTLNYFEACGSGRSSLVGAKGYVEKYLQPRTPSTWGVDFQVDRLLG